ncbi:MAG: toll/interleukin-1 receptor domain-containing protein, partial [Gemmatimonadota bacterium]|nr:toll/interleukin-1 receptor domain-containing protein [Gemmatimonadota bacterium]
MAGPQIGVYIAFVAQDEPFARRLFGALRSRGLRVQADDPIGDEASRLRAIPPLSDRTVIAAVVSRASLQSDAMALELRRAADLHRPLVRAMLIPSPRVGSGDRDEGIDFTNPETFETDVDRLAAAAEGAMESVARVRPSSAEFVFLSDNFAPGRDTRSTLALANVFRRAVLVNSEIVHDRFDLSFTSLLLGLVLSDNPTSAWLAEYVRRSSIDLTALSPGLTSEALERVRGLPAESDLGVTLTRSANTLIET